MFAQVIEDFFNMIQSLSNKEVDQLIVEYDEDYGYPRRISVDPDFEAMDEEYSYRIHDFEPL